MAKIFNLPEGVKVPEFNFSDIEVSKQEEKTFLDALRLWCKNNSKAVDKSYIGEVVKIPMGDGHALYMVSSLKPLELIHVPVGDAWDSPMAELLTTKKVVEMIDREKKIEAYFNARKK